MTYEEKQKAIIRAKKWIQDVIDYHQDVLNGEEPDDIEKAIFEECEVILDALEKQIPKKPICIEDKMWVCPVCDNNLLNKWVKYPTKLVPKSAGLPHCLGCGQAIDWSDEE